MLQILHDVNCMCCKLHVMQIACVANCTCCKLPKAFVGLRQCTNWKVNFPISKLAKASSKENWSIQQVCPADPSSWSMLLIHLADLSCTAHVSCMCRKLHVLPIVYAANFTWYKLHVLQIAHVANCTWCKLHVLQIALVANYPRPLSDSDNAQTERSIFQ